MIADEILELFVEVDWHGEKKAKDERTIQGR
jgi:hypothetical protein